MVESVVGEGFTDVLRGCAKRDEEDVGGGSPRRLFLPRTRSLYADV